MKLKWLFGISSINRRIPLVDFGIPLEQLLKKRSGDVTIGNDWRHIIT